MSWGIVASVGSAAVSAYSSSRSAKRGAQAAERSAELADQAARAELDFAKEQYDDWKVVFGDLQDNLSGYYNSLTPDSYAARGLQSFTRENAQVLQELRENLDQRGLGTSGIAAQTEIDFAQFSAEQRAQIRADAPRQAAAEQLGFLQVGLGQDPSGTLQTVLGSQSRTAGQIAQNTANASAAAREAELSSRANLISSIGEGIEDWRNR